MLPYYTIDRKGLLFGRFLKPEDRHYLVILAVEIAVVVVDEVHDRSKRAVIEKQNFSHCCQFGVQRYR